MFEMVLNSFRKRLLSSILLALVGAGLLELIFQLQYRYYKGFQSFEWFMGAIILTVLFTEIIYHLKYRLDRAAAWDKQPVYRLFLQILSYWTVGILIFTGIRLLYVYLISARSFILFSDELTIALFIFVGIVIMNIVDFGIILLRQRRDTLAEAEKYKKESAEFEFEMLQAQINPHFLFNSLNTLSSLVYEDADRSAEFIRKLSDVYRHVLDSRHKELIDIREELSFIESYIFLLELRFEKKLKVEIQIADNLLERKIAPLTLQLLIENAVKHNVVSSKKPLEVKIFSDNKFIIVENSMQEKAITERGNGMGLRNINSRYNSLCGEKIIISDADNIFTVKIPII